MNVIALLGTSRAGNASSRVFTEITAALREQVTVTEVRPEDVLTAPVTARTKDVSDTSSALHTWQQQVEESDRIVMVVPEYNHSFPGEWKLLMDALAPAACKDKPVYLATVSGGAFAGVRVAEHVQPILHTLGFVLKGSALHVPQVDTTYPSEGEMDEATRERLEQFVAAICS